VKIRWVDRRAVGQMLWIQTSRAPHEGFSAWVEGLTAEDRRDPGRPETCFYGRGAIGKAKAAAQIVVDLRGRR